jgi:hypothetical protein
MTDTAPPTARLDTPVIDTTRVSIALAGRVTVADQFYWRDAKGALVPEELVKAADKVIDDQVRKIMGHALELSAQIARFKQHTLDDVADLLDLLLQDYKTKIGGEKGNVSLTSYDGTLQVRLQIQERLTFGPELQAAKANVDAYLTELAADQDPVLRGLVHHAFRTDQAGLINRAELFRLLRYEIADDRWQQAMRAIKDSIRVEGTKEHVRFYQREDARSKWTAVTIDVADA